MEEALDHVRDAVGILSICRVRLHDILQNLRNYLLGEIGESRHLVQTESFVDGSVDLQFGFVDRSLGDCDDRLVRYESIDSSVVKALQQCHFAVAYKTFKGRAHFIDKLDWQVLDICHLRDPTYLE